MKRIRSFLIPVPVLLLLAACPTTYEARDVAVSGFLKDYSILEKGEGDDPLLIYINPDVDWKKYDKILIEPVALVRLKDSDLAELDPNEANQLAAYLAKSLRTQLGEDYKLVSRSGSGVIRLRMAITEASDSMAALDFVTTILPFGLAISGVKRLATGTGTFMGEASVEGELTDSQTGALLAAGVDRRVGGKTPSGVFQSWDDVESAFDWWAEHLRERLAEMREK